MDAFWSALADFLAKMEHQKASGRANLTKVDVKKTGLKKHRKMKGYCGSRWRRWWGQAEGGESKDSSSGVFCKDLETATSLSDGPDIQCLRPTTATALTFGSAEARKQ